MTPVGPEPLYVYGTPEKAVISKISIPQVADILGLTIVTQEKVAREQKI